MRGIFIEKYLKPITNNWSITFTFLFAVTISLFYFGWFFYQGQTISLDSTAWGSFGDFFGGIMNPLVAMIVLLWLVKSVNLQKEELQAASKELKNSSDAMRATLSHYERESKKESYFKAILSCEESIDRLKNKRIDISFNDTAKPQLISLEETLQDGNKNFIKLTIESKSRIRSRCEEILKLLNIIRVYCLEVEDGDSDNVLTNYYGIKYEVVANHLSYFCPMCESTNNFYRVLGRQKE